MILRYHSIYYNPAGLAKIKDGLYIDLGNQGGIKWYENRFLGQSVHDAEPVFLMPNFGLAYKNNRGAVFASLCVPAGGGDVNYRNQYGIGVLALSGLVPAGYPVPNQLKASSFWLQFSLGGAFSLTDWLAFTAGMKYNTYSYEMSFGYMGKGTIVKNRMNAACFTGFGGILVTPVKMLNIALLYSSQVIARGTLTDLKLHFSQISEARLPDYLLMGVNVKPVETVEIQLSYQLNFSQQRNYGTPLLPGLAPPHAMLREFVYGGYNYILGTSPTVRIGGNIQNYKYRISHKVGIGAEYLVHKMVLLSAGLSYETQEVYPYAQNIFDPSLCNLGVGLGGKIIINEMISLELAVARYFFIPARAQFELVKMTKSITNFGIGITVKTL